jgi:DNA modification methylase
MKSEIICGDVLEELKKMQDESFDLIITSPPYNLGNNHHTEITDIKVTKIICLKKNIKTGRYRY